MRPRLLLLLLVLAGLTLAPSTAAAKPKPVKPGASFTVPCPTGQLPVGGEVSFYDKHMEPLGVGVGVPDGTGVRFGPAPNKTAFAVVTRLDCRPPATTTSTSTSTSTSTTTTTLAPTTTTRPDTNLYLTGSGTVTDQGLFIYGDPSIPGVQHCPAGYVVDFAASTFTHPPNITVEDFTAAFDSIIAFADQDTTGTISWRIACRQVTP